MSALRVSPVLAEALRGLASDFRDAELDDVAAEVDALLLLAAGPRCPCGSCETQQDYDENHRNDEGGY